MARRCLRLAAAVANRAEREAGNTYAWFLAMASAWWWDSGVILIPAS